MDSRGNIYQVEELQNEELKKNLKEVKEGDKVNLYKMTNIETGKTSLSKRLDNMISLEKDLKDKLLGMNRAERRKWFKENKK